MELWSEKYRPRTIDELVLNEKTIDSVKQWLFDYANKKTDKRALIFTGPPGLGKTSFAHIILNELGYSVTEFNASDIRSKSQVQQNLYNLMMLRDVGKSCYPSKPMGVGIIMDEVDGMLVGLRGGLTQLLEFITPPSKKRKNSKKSIMGNKWGPPMICICNTGNLKKTTLNLLVGTCFEIKFVQPSNTAMKKVVDRIMKSEGLHIKPDAVNHIITYAQKDFRRLTCLLQHLNDVYGKKITSNHVAESYQIFCKKEQDLYTTDSLKRIFNTMYDYQSVMSIYQRDKSKSPMVIHENYISSIALQKCSAMTKIDNAIKCIDSIIGSDIIEKTMYNTQVWYLQPIQGMLCCYIPSYYMNCRQRTANLNYIKWTSVLGRNSHTQNDRKNAYELAYSINTKFSYTIYDVQMLSEMIMYYLTHNCLKHGASIMRRYNMEFSDIVKMIRCVKLTDYGDKWKKGGINKSSIKTMCARDDTTIECTKSKVKPNSYFTMTKTKTKTKTKTGSGSNAKTIIKTKNITTRPKRKLVLIKRSKK